MAKETERKFLVNDHTYRGMATSCGRIVQGYLSADPRATVRVRIRDGRGYITVKSKNVGAVRDEWEYEIPRADADEMLKRLSCGRVIDKIRYIVPWKGHVWEVDEFSQPCEGMVVAEVELTRENEEFEIPPFVGEEVTGRPEYYNSVMASAPC